MLQRKVFWVTYTFLQKPSSFKLISILEENCGADIINGTFKCKTFVDKCCKKALLSGLYFPTKVKFFQVSQHLLFVNPQTDVDLSLVKAKYSWGNTFFGKMLYFVSSRVYCIFIFFKNRHFQKSCTHCSIMSRKIWWYFLIMEWKKFMGAGFVLSR